MRIDFISAKNIGGIGVLGLRLWLGICQQYIFRVICCLVVSRPHAFRMVVSLLFAFRLVASLLVGHVLACGILACIIQACPIPAFPSRLFLSRLVPSRLVMSQLVLPRPVLSCPNASLVVTQPELSTLAQFFLPHSVMLSSATVKHKINKYYTCCEVVTLIGYEKRKVTTFMWCRSSGSRDFMGMKTVGAKLFTGIKTIGS